MSQITKSLIYDTNNSPKDISVSIDIGFGQNSITTIYIDGAVFNNGINNSFQGVIIGSGNSLIRKEIVIFTSIVDIQPSTNQTSLKLKINGGGGVHNEPALRQTLNSGEVAFHKLNIIII
jgi:hypothetical protein